MIELNNITKSFGTLQVLRGINLQISKGEVVAIVGPSGAGKTTLLQIMGTLDKPDTGKVLIKGQDVFRLSGSKLSKFRNQHIGFVFQFHQLLPEFTALENIMIPAMIGGVNKGEARKRALELLQFMKLSDRADHKPNELSGGEKQRVAVARALSPCSYGRPHHPYLRRCDSVACSRRFQVSGFNNRYPLTPFPIHFREIPLRV